MDEDEKIRICLECNVSCSLCTGDANSPPCPLYMHKSNDKSEKVTTRHKRIATELGYEIPSQAAKAIFEADGDGHRIIETFGCSRDTARKWLQASGTKIRGSISWKNINRNEDTI